MTKRKMFLVILLFVLVLICFRIPWMLLSDDQHKVKVDQGAVDLRGWDFTTNGSLYLDGEWDFYPNTLLSPEKIRENKFSIKKQSITVPSNEWKEIVEQSGSNVQIGTYQIKLLVDDHEKGNSYSLMFPKQTSVSKVFVNNELVLDNGEVNAKNPYTLKRIATFKVEQEKSLDIIVQLAINENNRTKGIMKSVKFGKASAIQNALNLSIGFQLLVAVFLLLHFIYSTFLIMFRRHYAVLIYFSCATISAVIATLMDDDHLLLYLLDMSYVSSVKVLFISYTGISLFFLLFIRRLFGGYRHHKVIQMTILLQILIMIYLLFSSLQSILLISKVVFLMISLSFVLMVFLLWQDAKKEESTLLFLILATISIMHSFLWGFYKSGNAVELPYYPFDIIIAFIAFSLYLFVRIFNISDENKLLSLQLQKELNQKDEFLANTAHELRNPLHGIINIAYSMSQQGKKATTTYAKENLEVIMHIGRQMSQTLNDLLDISKLKEHQIKLQKVELNIRSVIIGVMDMVKLMVGNKNIQINMDISNTFPNIVADKNRFIQIMYNLLHNAIKFTDEGTIYVRAEVKHNKAVICVEDTGIGMSEETIKRIFKPYEQGDASITAIGGGIGLGLSICKQLVDAHDGTLEVESIINEGTVFYFTMPLAEEKHQSDEFGKPDGKEESAEEAFPMNLLSNPTMNNISTIENNSLLTFKPKILMVDDDPVNLKVLTNILVPDQYEIMTASSGKDALERLPMEEWDLVISDVMMPHMSGYELTRKIRKKFSFIELPILLLTARNQSEDINTGFLAGANDYVVKPTDPLELKVRVNALSEFKKSIHEHSYMEAAWLQAQIRPHFLFNTLNTIVSLSEVDTDRLADLLHHFGLYLQKSFNPKNVSRLVPLKDELDLVRSYLYIEKQRFNERLEIQWVVETKQEVSVPPLSVQTIVENAICHGVMNKLEGGTIRIYIHDDTEGTEIAIIDDGVGMEQNLITQLLNDQVNSEGGIGLRNTNKRLVQLFGKGLQIKSAKGKGTTVQFLIPK